MGHEKAGESAMDSYPVDSTETLTRIAAATEPYRPMVNTKDMFKGINSRSKVPPARLIDLCVQTVLDYADLVAVFVPTRGGNTTRSISRLRVPVWIIAVSSEETTCQQLQFSSGVIPVCEREHPKTWKSYVSEWLRNNGMEGRLVAVTEGPSRMYPDTNNRLEILDMALRDEYS